MWWPSWIFDKYNRHNFWSGPPKDYLDQIWFHSIKWFWRRILKKVKPVQAVIFIKRSPFSCPVTENFIWIEPVLKDNFFFVPKVISQYRFDWISIFQPIKSHGGHLESQERSMDTILEEDHPRRISQDWFNLAPWFLRRSKWKKVNWRQRPSDEKRATWVFGSGELKYCSALTLN
jgi:hypothetical protein